MIEDSRIHKILYGGDYNPEQWPEDVWEEDMRLFKLAGIDTVTLNTFSWAALQPNETTYNFEKLDKIMDMAEENGLHVCMATSTAAHPAWMARKYPDVLRMDHNGIQRKFGSRHNSCPNSPTYRKYSVILAEKLAKRYKDRKSITAWHISNEYGGECYCENCEKAFRVWLQKKYHTVENLNQAWNTAFWGHTFYDWDDVVLPDMRSEHFGEDRTNFQGISLDYRRFNSDSILECYQLEYDAIKEVIPDAQITTNLMNFYKGLDYQKWAKNMDFVSWDNYPTNQDPYSRMAMSHDLMRSLKQGKPFALMEQTPSVTNWQSYNALKRPGVMRLWSFQAVAHGSDTVLFFQMRRSIGACEKFHGAVIDHVGNEHTRVFREIAKLGRELEKLGDGILGSRSDAKAAILFDWDNWWALEYSAGPSCDLKYLDEIFSYYRALEEQNYPVDFVSVEDDLEQYEIVIAPVLYMTKPGCDERIRRFVSNGGTFIATYFSGIVDDHDLVITGGYPGKLRDILGISVEESDALPKDASNSFTYNGKKYPATLLCDLSHLEGAVQIGFYEQDFYAGMPAITVNTYGKGKAYYVATRSNEEFYKDFLKDCLDEKKIRSLYPQEGDIEVTKRWKGNKSYTFVLNHGDESKKILFTEVCTDLLTDVKYQKDDYADLSGKGVMILEGELS